MRNKKLESLVNAAAGPAVPQPHSRTCSLDRIDLREEACMGRGSGASAGEEALGNGPPMSSLPEITEDGAEGTICVVMSTAKGLCMSFSQHCHTWCTVDGASCLPSMAMSNRFAGVFKGEVAPACAGTDASVRGLRGLAANGVGAAPSQ